MSTLARRIVKCPRQGWREVHECSLCPSNSTLKRLSPPVARCMNAPCMRTFRHGRLKSHRRSKTTRNDDNQSSDHFEPWSNNEQYLSDESLDDDDDQETEADFTLDEDLDENEEDSSPSTPSVLRSFRYIDIGGEALQSLNSIFRHKSRQEFRAIMIECLSNCCDKAPEYYGKEPKAIVMGIHAYLAFLRRQDLVEDCVDSIIRAVPRSTQALLGTQWHAEQLKGLEGIHQSDGAGIYLDYVHTDGSLYPEHCAYAGSTNKFSRRLGQYEKSARTGVPAERGYHNQVLASPGAKGHLRALARWSLDYRPCRLDRDA